MGRFTLKSFHHSHWRFAARNETQQQGGEPMTTSCVHSGNQHALKHGGYGRKLLLSGFLLKNVKAY